jgi:plasmid stabilization system protein ParE
MTHLETPRSFLAVIREILVSSYRLIYRVRDDTIEIIAVLHQRRSFERWRRQRS